MIIDTSNAPCGPGFLPGLRLSEGRFFITRRRSPASPQLGLSQARFGAASVPPSADAFVKCLPHTSVSPHPPPPWCGLPSHLLTLPPLSTSERGASRRAPHELGAAAGGQNSCLRAARVTRASGSGGQRTSVVRGLPVVPRVAPSPGCVCVCAGVRACVCVCTANPQNKSRVNAVSLAPPAPAKGRAGRATPARPIFFSTPLSGQTERRDRGRPWPPSTTTSDQTRQPAEFKHITKRRKRN